MNKRMICFIMTILSLTSTPIRANEPEPGVTSLEETCEGQRSELIGFYREKTSSGSFSGGLLNKALTFLGAGVILGGIVLAKSLVKPFRCIATESTEGEANKVFNALDLDDKTRLSLIDHKKSLPTLKRFFFNLRDLPNDDLVLLAKIFEPRFEIEVTELSKPEKDNLVAYLDHKIRFLLIRYMEEFGEQRIHPYVVDLPTPTERILLAGYQAWVKPDVHDALLVLVKTFSEGTGSSFSPMTPALYDWNTWGYYISSCYAACCPRGLVFTIKAAEQGWRQPKKTRADVEEVRAWVRKMDTDFHPEVSGTINRVKTTSTLYDAFFGTLPYYGSSNRYVDLDNQNDPSIYLVPILMLRYYYGSQERKHEIADILASSMCQEPDTTCCPHRLAGAIVAAYRMIDIQEPFPSLLFTKLCTQVTSAHSRSTEWQPVEGFRRRGCQNLDLLMNSVMEHPVQGTVPLTTTPFHARLAALPRVGPQLWNNFVPNIGILERNELNTIFGKDQVNDKLIRELEQIKDIEGLTELEAEGQKESKDVFGIQILVWEQKGTNTKLRSSSKGSCWTTKPVADEDFDIEFEETGDLAKVLDVPASDVKIQAKKTGNSVDLTVTVKNETYLVRPKDKFDVRVDGSTKKISFTTPTVFFKSTTIKEARELSVDDPLICPCPTGERKSWVVERGKISAGALARVAEAFNSDLHMDASGANERHRLEDYPMCRKLFRQVYEALVPVMQIVPDFVSVPSKPEKEAQFHHFFIALLEFVQQGYLIRGANQRT